MGERCDEARWSRPALYKVRPHSRPALRSRTAGHTVAALQKSPGSVWPLKTSRQNAHDLAATGLTAAKGRAYNALCPQATTHINVDLIIIVYIEIHVYIRMDARHAGKVDEDVSLASAPVSGRHRFKRGASRVGRSQRGGHASNPALVALACVAERGAGGRATAHRHCNTAPHLEFEVVPHLRHERACGCVLACAPRRPLTITALLCSRLRRMTQRFGAPPPTWRFGALASRLGPSSLGAACCRYVGH